MRNISEVINGTVTNRTDSILTPKLGGGGRGLVCPLIVDNTYVHTYFCDPAADFAVLGTISLLLTILNIICIFIMGIIVLKVSSAASAAASASSWGNHDYHFDWYCSALSVCFQATGLEAFFVSLPQQNLCISPSVG